MPSEFRTTLRGLSRARGFTSITILTLALGMGAATAIFNVVDWVLFRSADYPPGMVTVGRELRNGQFISPQSGVVLQHYETRRDLFVQTGRAAIVLGNIVANGQPIGRGSVGVTANTLTLLDISPSLGRSFRAEEFTDGINNVVILTHRFWQDKFGGDPAVLGRSLIVDGTPCTVIGVVGKDQALPPLFNLGVLRPHEAVSDPARPWTPPYNFYAQLQAGQTAESVQTALRESPPELSPQLTRSLLSLATGVRAMDATGEWLRPGYYWVMLGAVAFLYAIACLNAANLILVRRLGQARESAIRLALGASNRDIIRHGVIESVLLVGAGTVGALIVANAMLPIMMSFVGTSDPTDAIELWRLDSRAILILLGLAGLTAVLITVVPIVRVLRMRPVSHLKDTAGALGETRGLSHFRGALVVLQFAAALILLAGTGLMVRTIQNLHAAEPGYAIEGRFKIALTLPRDGPRDFEAMTQLWRDMKTKIEQMPGVIKAGYSSEIVLSGFAQPNAKIENPGGEPVDIAHHTMDEGFIAAAGLQLLRGRNIDQRETQTEVLINEKLAALRWPGEDPIGQLVVPVSAGQQSSAEKNGLQVVGVIRDPKATPQLDAPPAVYRAITVEGQSFIVHVASSHFATFGDDVRRKIYAWNPEIVIFNTTSIADLHDHYIAAETLALSVLRVLTVIAVILTAVGIFALLAFSVGLRRGEFGVRLALGASTGHLMALVFRQGLRLAVIGTLVGLGGAWALVSTIESLLYGTSPHDPLVFGIVAVVLILIGLLACIVPAIRATRVDIAKLLRSE